MGFPRKKRVTVNDSRDEWDHILAGDIISPETIATVVNRICDFLIR